MAENQPSAQNSNMDVSIIIPIYNEAQNIVPLYNNIFESVNRVNTSCEIIFIDDGSTDETPNILKEVYQKAKSGGISVKSVRFERNMGKSACLSVGFREAGAGIIITMDGDLQDDPKEIPRFIEKIKEGFDLVSGWRRKRQDPAIKVIQSRLFNAIVSFLTEAKIHDYNCCFKAYKRSAVRELDLYGDLYRFIPALAHQKGLKITEIEVRHFARIHGKSKYGMWRLFEGFYDLITIIFLTRFASKPLHFFGSVGLLSFIIGLTVIGFLYIRKFVFCIFINHNPYLFLLGIMLIIVGVQLFSIGLLGELMIKINPGTKMDVRYKKEIGY